jgi:predicted nucleic acid-binding protein
VVIRKRLGGEEFDKFHRHIIEESERLKPHQARITRKKKNEILSEASDNSDIPENHKQEDSGKDTDNTDKPDKPDTLDEPDNRGTLKVDATVADQEIKYPNDVSLLNESRRHLERMIRELYEESIDGKRPRLYPQKARKEYLNFSKKRRKSKKEVRRGIKAQLQYVHRDLKVIDKMLLHTERTRQLNDDDKIMLEVIRKIYEQQKWMYDNKTHKIDNRIVSLYQWWVRPIVRGKDKSKVEFGAKINVSEVNGFCRIDQFSWEAFNEGILLKEQIENFRTIYGCYPKYLLADRIYLNRENRKYLKEKNIKITGKPLGRPPARETQTASDRYRKKKKAAERNHIEGKFGQGKRGYHLNNIKARLPETSESWINAIFLVMNLTKLLLVAEKYGKIFTQFLFQEILPLFNRKIHKPVSFLLFAA